MKVKLGNHLEEYLHEHHHNIVSLELDMKPGKHEGEQFQTNPRMPEPRIIFSKPLNESNFTKYTYHDITVFVADNIKAKNDELVIMDQIVDGVDTCHVKGWVGNN